MTHPSDWSARLDDCARFLYEQGRKEIEGRPATLPWPVWEDLDPDDPYDIGMRAAAYFLARGMIQDP